MNAVHDFIASLISDPVMREPALSVFSALPEGVQEEFMGDPGFVIGMYDTAPRAFAHYVIAHELAHALLRNRGRGLSPDPPSGTCRGASEPERCANEQSDERKVRRLPPRCPAGDRGGDRRTQAVMAAKTDSLGGG